MIVYMSQRLGIIKRGKRDMIGNVEDKNHTQIAILKELIFVMSISGKKRKEVVLEAQMALDRILEQKNVTID